MGGRFLGRPDVHLVQQRKQVGWVTGLTFGHQHGQRAAFSLAQHVDLAVSSPTADPEPLVRERPLFSSWAGCFRAFATGAVQGRACPIHLSLSILLDLKRHQDAFPAAIS